MRVANLADFLIKLYNVGAVNHYRQSVLLLGPPGIGKSYTTRYSFAERMASILGKEFVDYDDDMAHTILKEPDRYFTYVDFRLTECEPSDLLGIPFRENGSVRFAPLLWARVLSKTAGVLVLDELTNVQRDDVISVAYKILFDRRVGFIKLGDDVMIIACGNRPEHSSVARLLPTPLINRCLVIDVAPPTVDQWARFMDATYSEWDRRVYAFLKAFEEEGYLLQVPRKMETLDPYPTPRTWTSLAIHMAKGVESRELIKGLVGEEVGQKFLAFLEVKVDIDELISEPQRWKRLSMDARYMASVMLATWITRNIKRRVERCFRLMDEMSETGRDFIVITLIAIPDKRVRIPLVKSLFQYDPRYKDFLLDVVSIKQMLKT